MASTSLKKNIVAIVQARCNSIRLPNKIMRKIAGMPAIAISLQKHIMEHVRIAARERAAVQFIQSRQAVGGAAAEECNASCTHFSPKIYRLKFFLYTL